MLNFYNESKIIYQFNSEVPSLVIFKNLGIGHRCGTNWVFMTLNGRCIDLQTDEIEDSDLKDNVTSVFFWKWK